MTASTGSGGGTGSGATPRRSWIATRRATPWRRPARCTRTRGRKGIPHPDPADRPRRRADRRRGRGSFADDRPPIAGVVGRASGEVRLEVLDSAGGAELEALIDATCPEEVAVNTDEWKGYSRVGTQGRRTQRAVDHAGPEGTWALDLDGDGVREVHCNTQQGRRTGLRNFLRPFRGASEWYLDQYVALFPWGHNVKRATEDFLRALRNVAEHQFGLMSQRL